MKPAQAGFERRRRQRRQPRASQDRPRAVDTATRWGERALTDPMVSSPPHADSPPAGVSDTAATVPRGADVEVAPPDARRSPSPSSCSPASSSSAGSGFVGVGQRLRLLQPRPDRSRRSSSSSIAFEQPSIVYDRTGNGRARPVRRPPPRARDVRRHPAGDDRRHDRDRGQGLLDEPRLRHRRHRLRRPRHPRRPAARRLDDHPAARAGPPAARRRLRGLGLRPEDPGDHPVDPPHPGLPGRRRARSRSWRPTSTRTSTATRATA